MNATPNSDRPYLPALDGIRFLAAFLVMFGHGYWFMMMNQQVSPTTTGLDIAFVGVPALGMTLFFVLSGVVIHLNYHACGGIRGKGKLEFIAARFARLYPLFLIIFAYELINIFLKYGYGAGQLYQNVDLFSPLPFVLSFTQSWFYVDAGGNLPHTAYGVYGSGAVGMMWSLSTEWFFYAMYLVIGGIFTRLSTRGTTIAFGIITALCVTYFYGIFFYRAVIDAWATTAISPMATQGMGDNHFFHWLTFNSPYGRLFEFLAGVCIAQRYRMRATITPHRFGTQLTWVAWVALIATILYFNQSKTAFQSIASPCFAWLAAISIYLVMRSPSGVQRFFGHRWMVMGGAASYSLYLLHHYVLHSFMKPYAFIYSPALVLVVGCILSIAVARISYLYFERPTTRWTRANFIRLNFHWWLPILLVVITVLSAFSAMQVRSLQRLTTPPAVGKIEVIEASFGANCKAELKNNMLEPVRQNCNSLDQCLFKYNVNRLPDPASGCLKTFDVLYRCGPATAERTQTVTVRTAEFEVPFACTP
jgi:peptidoglycan/LPS O-acetylase OafA/YrhL